MTRPRPAAAPLALAVASCLASATAQAEVRIVVQPDPPRPIAGQPFRVSYALEIVNEGGTIRATPLEAGPGLQVMMHGGAPSPPNVMMMGGPGAMMRFTSSVEYVLVAQRPGRYTIRGARAVLADTGRVLAQHPPVTVVVEADRGQTAQPAQRPRDPWGPGGFFPPGIFGDPSDPPTPQPPPEPIRYEGPDVPPEGPLTGGSFDPRGFLRAHLSRTRAYVGEEVVFRTWIYAPANEAGCEPLLEPTLTGFWNNILLTPTRACAERWIPQTVQDRGMAAGMVRHLALYPTRAGTLDVGPMRMNIEYIVGDAFFGRRQLVAVASPALRLEALDAPAAGRPADYAPGTVGEVTLGASLDRTTARVGETLTLTLRAEGNGYLGAVTLPRPTVPEGVRLLPGTARTTLNTDALPVRATVTQDYRLVPERPGALVLPAYSVAWLDPATGEYRRTRIDLPGADITGEAAPADADAQRDDPAIALEPFRPNIPLDAHRAWFGTAARVWGALLALPLALALGGLVRALRRLQAARTRARAETAHNDPEALFAQARDALATGTAREALDGAGRAVQRARVLARGLEHPEAVLRALDEAQGRLDALRFAGQGVTAEDARPALDAVRAALDALEAAS